ncbi:MAG: hypothetical protein IJQ02_07945 [Oscillospiraceae bacterium]|nr:hypothetical protein [Oscillospiraceae bacterium]MBR0392831.1 hypothetical protein [Oscillospiraceae bacterium]
MKKRLIALLLTMLILCAPLTAFAENADETGGTIEPAEPALPAGTTLIDEEALNSWMDGYIAEHGLNGSRQDFSVGFCYTATGDCWFYNADTWMYSASLYKVPVSMLIAEKVAAGELTQESIIMGTTVEYLESTALVYSNNTSGHNMVDYLGGTYLGKCSDMTIPYTDLSEEYFDQNFYDLSYYTARYMTQVMKTLYDNPERFPHVMEFLLQALPDNYYNIKLGDRYEIAQKYGSYEEPNGNKNNHCAAVIYTPTPIIVTVMTRNADYFETRIAEVGSYLADYSLTLDARAEQLRIEEEERLAAEAAAAQAAAEAAVSAGNQSPDPPASGTGGSGMSSAQGTEAQARSSKLPMILLGLAGLIFILILVLLVIDRRNTPGGTGRVASPAARTAVREREQSRASESPARKPKTEKRADTPTAEKKEYRPRH